MLDIIKKILETGLSIEKKVIQVKEAVRVSQEASYNKVESGKEE